jgi:LysR family transcriptional regulator, transcription activator of glutamate synthase operon
VQVQELRWFAAAVAEPNLSRVAEHLHVSQPALSRSLRRLEAAVGTDLFDRVGRSLEPNAHGRLLAAHVTRALAELDDGTEAVRQAADPERGEVRLAFLHTFGTWLVPELIRAYRAEHPRARFHLSQGSAGVTLEGLRTGRHDLLVTSPRPEDPAVGWRRLFVEPLRLAVPADHRLAGRRRVRLREVADDDFIILSPEHGLRALTDRLCERAGFSPRVAFEGEDAETLRGLVAAGLGVALLPGRPGAPSSPPLLAVADAGAERAVGLAWHRRRYRSPAVTAFAEFVSSAHARVVAGYAGISSPSDPAATSSA